MSIIATTQIADQYSAKFGNLDEVAHPSIFFTAEFGALLEKAIQRGSPLTRAEVETAFGPLSWEE